VEADLSPGAVSRRLGIAVTTLRTWHQRYGLGPSGHSAGTHRRYNPEDLIRLETMRRLTGQGVPAAEAARIAKSDAALLPNPARAGGGSAIPVGRAGPAARGIASAAMRLDMPTVRERVSAQISEYGVVRAWTEVLVPVLVGIGERQAATSKLIEVEHLLSRCIGEVLATIARPGPGTPVNVLLACADEEQHSLPLEAMAAALAERGTACRLLGARVPSSTLAQAVRRTGPAVVVIWSHAPETGDPAQLRALLDLPARPAIIVAAGPGWADVPSGVLTPATLADAMSIALAAH
jgi:DNA-binding transcriptional MerR regulator